MRRTPRCLGRIAVAVAAALGLVECQRKPGVPQIDPDAWASAIPTSDTVRAHALYTRTRVIAGESEPVSCAVCHGADGGGNYGRDNPRHIAPRLAGLNATYVGEQLRAYANGTRVFPLMHAMAAPLGAQDVADLAVYVHALKGPGRAPPDTPLAVLDRGHRIWVEGVPGKVASCASCHGPDGAGGVLRSPEIAGEPRPYLEAQLKTMREGRRTGTVAADTMTEVAHRLSDADAQAVAAYIATIQPVSARAGAGVAGAKP